MSTRVSLAELIDADVSLRPDEAVAIVREVCRQLAEGGLRGVPNATVIRLTSDGRIAVEGPVNRDQDPVRAAAALLGDLLPGFHSPTGFKVPGGLRLVLARAMRTLDLPPFAGVPEFCAALERFAAADVAETVRRLFETWASSHQALPSALPARAELTISDVRRARRATGLSLDDISQASGIPTTRLRELEWGYLRNWTADDRGRDELKRYARAAGVDEDVVLSVAWPLLESAAHEPVVDVVAVEAPSPTREHWALVAVPPRDASTANQPASTTPATFLGNYRWLVALAAAVVLMIAVLALGWERGAQPIAVAETRREPVAETTVADEADAPPLAPRSVAPQPRQTVSAKAPAPRHRPAKAKSRPAPAPERKSFFKRELFRITIK